MYRLQLENSSPYLGSDLDIIRKASKLADQNGDWDIDETCPLESSIDYLKTLGWKIEQC